MTEATITCTVCGIGCPVPAALTCALEANGYEDAIRNAISLGGDSDTLAAIAGGVAEARFGIPEEIAAQGWGRLPGDMRGVLEGLYGRAGAALPRAPAAGLRGKTEGDK